MVKHWSCAKFMYCLLPHGRERLNETRWETVPNWECRNKVPKTWSDIKFVPSKAEIVSPMRKKLMKWGRTWMTSAIVWPRVFWIALNANASWTKVSSKNSRKMFESRISAGATENYLGGRILAQKTVACWHDREGAKKVRGKILPVGQQKDWAVVQSLNSL